jgi:hypothetical protein
MWSHSSDSNNIFFKFLKELKVKMKKSDHENSLEYYTNGDKIEINEKKFDDLEELFYTNVKKIYRKYKNSSFYEIIKMALNNTSFPSKYYEKCFIYNIYSYTNLDYGVHPKKLSNTIIDTYLDDEEENNFLLINGFSEVIEHLSKDINIITNSSVTQIDYSQSISKSVFVSTVDNKKYECDHVVVTVPLGVLKRKVIEFIPDLPKEKYSAFDQLGKNKI